MPITPRLSVCYFDSGVYNFPGSHSIYRNINRKSDVFALNELQVLNADKNIYFADWRSCEVVRSEVDAARENRPPERMAFDVFIEDPIGRELYHDGQSYRKATEKEIFRPIPKIVSFRPIYPVPSRWMSVLGYRSKPRVFTNGTGVGFVRKESWLNAEGREIDGL